MISIYWYHGTQAPFPTHNPNNVILRLQMHTLNNALLFSIDSKKFLQLPWNFCICVAIGLWRLSFIYVFELLDSNCAPKYVLVICVSCETHYILQRELRRNVPFGSDVSDIKLPTQNFTLTWYYWNTWIFSILFKLCSN